MMKSRFDPVGQKQRICRRSLFWMAADRQRETSVSPGRSSSTPGWRGKLNIESQQHADRDDVDDAENDPGITEDEAQFESSPALLESSLGRPAFCHVPTDHGSNPGEQPESCQAAEEDGGDAQSHGCSSQ